MRQTSRWGGLLALALAAPLVGCGTEGELGNGTFWYHCSSGSDDDVACEVLSSRRDIPSTIAVGAPFSVSFTPHASQLEPGVSEDDIIVVPASAARIAQNGSSFTLLDEGKSSLLAQAPDQSIFDYTHLSGAYIADIDIISHLDAVVDPLVLRAGETAWLLAEPVSLSGNTLAGKHSYVWSTSDETVASLESGGFSRKSGVRAEAPGTATVTVGIALGTMSRSIQVEVQP